MRFTTLIALALTAITVSAMPISNAGGVGAVQGAVGKATDKAKTSLPGTKAVGTGPVPRTVPGENEVKPSVDGAKKAATGVVHARGVPNPPKVEQTTGKVEKAASGVHVPRASPAGLAEAGQAGSTVQSEVKQAGGEVEKLKGETKGVNPRSATSGLTKPGEAAVVQGVVDKATEATQGTPKRVSTRASGNLADGASGAVDGALKGAKGAGQGANGLKGAASS